MKRDVGCPFSAAIETFERLHKTGALYSVGPFSGLQSRVRCELAEVGDYTDRARRHEALILQWRGASRMLPRMRSMITVRPNGPVTELRMEGRYTPPFGVLGALFDRIIGKRIAQRTLDRFLDEVRDFIERQWQDGP